MAFNAAATNNDDHPRNYALLRRQQGWRLSPAYDLARAPVVRLERRDLPCPRADSGWWRRKRRVNPAYSMF